MRRCDRSPTGIYEHRYDMIRSTLEDILYATTVVQQQTWGRTQILVPNNGKLQYCTAVVVLQSVVCHEIHQVAEGV